MADALDPFWAAAENASRFFSGDSDVHRALRALAEVLEQEGIPYVIAGGMALNAHGYERVTRDVDVLLTREGLDQLKRKLIGRGYVEKFPGSRGLRDTVHRVDIDVLLAGDFPGDGKPKPVAFPDPAAVAVRRAGAAFLPVEKLVELKLASGLSATHRLRDLADVLELIRAASLPRTFAEQLDASVREKYLELWDAAQIADRE